MFLLLFSVSLLILAYVDTSSNRRCPEAEELSLKSHTIWQLRYNYSNPLENVKCEWDLHSPGSNYCLYIRLFDLDLLSGNGRCASYLEINGRDYCKRPEIPCMAFRLGDNSRCTSVSKLFEGEKCVVNEWENGPPKLFLRNGNEMNTLPRKYLITLIFGYYNFSNEVYSVWGRNEEVDNSSKNELNMTKADQFLESDVLIIATTVPLGVILLILIGILLGSIIVRRCKSHRETVKKNADVAYIKEGSDFNEYGTIEEGKYEIIDDFHRNIRDGGVLAQKEIVDNIIYAGGESEPPNVYEETLERTER